jgi:branched-chain amino acid transport system substrate-binding protein
VISCQRNMEIALKKHGMVDPVATATYVRGTMDIEGVLESIIASNARAVILIGTYDPFAKFIFSPMRRIA